MFTFPLKPLNHNTKTDNILIMEWLKDMNKERNFVLDFVPFIFHRSTASQT